MNRELLVALAAGGAVLASCSPGPAPGPPELRPGRDECAECGMLLSETRSAAAISLGGDEGSWLLFDDVGCMIDYESSHQGSVRARQVHDWESEIWTDGAAAVYVLADADRVRTPMGSGIAAFASVGGATKLKSAVGGSMLMLDELRGARREWREKRARAGLRP